MRKLWLIILMISLIIFSGCGTSSSQRTKPGEDPTLQEKTALHMQLTTPVETLDPAYVQNDSEIMISKAIFQGLVKENASGKVVPHIAEKWNMTPDKLTYTFYIKKGVNFHNGKEITANDFKFSWERVLRLEAPSAYLFMGIKGADEVLSGKDKVASGIVAIDDYTLQVTLNYPQKNFITALAHPATAVLDRYEVVEQGKDFAKPGTFSKPALIPSGTGPFRLMEWVDNRVIALGRNTSYFNEKPQVARVEFSLNQSSEDAVLNLLSGKLDVIQDVTKETFPTIPGENKELNIIKKPVKKFRYVGMNVKIAPFNIKQVRDAIFYGLNEKEILKSARGENGEVVSGYVTDYWYRKSQDNKSRFSYRPEMSAKLLAEAGFSGGQGLSQITVLCGPTEEDLRVGDKIKENLTELGFKVKMVSLSNKELRKAIESGEAGIYTAQFTAKTPELDSFFLEKVDSKWQKNIVNPLWDQLLISAAEQEKNGRINTYRQIEKEIVEDAQMRFLYTYNSAVVVGDKVKNINLIRENRIIFEEILLN